MTKIKKPLKENKLVKSLESLTYKIDQLENKYINDNAVLKKELEYAQRNIDKLEIEQRFDRDRFNYGYIRQDMTSRVDPSIARRDFWHKIARNTFSAFNILAHLAMFTIALGGIVSIYMILAFGLNVINYVPLYNMLLGVLVLCIVGLLSYGNGLYRLLTGNRND